MRNFVSRTDRLQHFSYRFHSGKVYGIVGGPSQGAWALSYLLSGNYKKFQGDIQINDRPAERDILHINGWYIGEGIRRGLFKRQLTIREQLEMGVSIDYTVDHLIEVFGLAPSRLDREMRYISNERWNASAAIGLAHGKQIFCFPWLNDEWKNAISGRMAHCSDILRRSNRILLIPVSNLSVVEDFIDEAVYLSPNK
jgi:ABC-type multidrug transport system ATPase subunit